MRLIDADEVYGKRFTVVDVIEGVPVHRNVVKAFDVKEAPTVEAIPIQWIKNKIAVNVHLWEEGKEKMFFEDGVAKIVSYSLTVQTLSQLLEWWEKENATD